jgi:serine-type D-Ala-D-Ala carboxypeptidase/endopeptidase (penicillin-binding protein 4)
MRVRRRGAGSRRSHPVVVARFALIAITAFTLTGAAAPRVPTERDGSRHAPAGPLFARFPAEPTARTPIARIASRSGATHDARTKDPAGDEVPSPPDSDHDRDRIVRLQDALREILKSRVLNRTRVGMRVASVSTGRLFFARHADVLMDPASNQKVLATTAALMRLGAGWTYRTELSGAAPDGDGVMAGNLYMRGNGDPSLRAARLSAWAADLRRRGITEITGGVVADSRRLGDDASAPAGSEDQTVRGPLVVDRGVTLVRVHPGRQAGAPALVLTNPPSPAEGEQSQSGFTIVNHAITKEGGKTRVAVKLAVAGGSLRVEVSGRIAMGGAGVAFRRRVPHPALHAAMMLRAALLAEGIGVREGASTGGGSSVTAPAGFVAVFRSDPLATLLRRINKDSDNDQAERVLQTVGAEIRGGSPATEKGLSVLREVLAGLGLRSADYVPQNGSGLGHANRITPGAMTELLSALYSDPRVGPDILQSLSVGGVDGTTRNRFKGTLAARRVRSKTGTLNGKSCLSGLVGDGGDVVVFSMMMQGVRGGTLHAVRASQVGAVNAMMRYVREGTGERASAPGNVDEENVGRDFETGGEMHESGQEGEQEGEDQEGENGIMEPTLDFGDATPSKVAP